jgi:succinate-acetate transporter protein
VSYAVFSTHMLPAIASTRTILTIFGLLTTVFNLDAIGSFVDNTAISKLPGTSSSRTRPCALPVGGEPRQREVG